jgi:hypothetical protein
MMMSAASMADQPWVDKSFRLSIAEPFFDSGSLHQHKPLIRHPRESGDPVTFGHRGNVAGFPLSRE